MPESNRSASPVRRRAAVGAFARGLLIFSQKQTIPVGLVYLPVQRVWRETTRRRTRDSVQRQTSEWRPTGVFALQAGPPADYLVLKVD